MSQDATLLTEMMEKAIVFSAEKMGFEGRDQVVKARARGDCSTCEYLRYGLAKEVANYLGATDQTINEVFFFEPEASTSMSGQRGVGPGLSPGISLIIRVSRKTAALESLIASVVSSVKQEYQRINCPEAKTLCNMIDIITVDDEEIECRTGYGALVGSLFMAPMEIWKRKM
jgi:hypothetical protein